MNDVICDISAVKCLKLTLLCCVAQMFPAMDKPRESHLLTLVNGSFHLLARCHSFQGNRKMMRQTVGEEFGICD